MSKNNNVNPGQYKVGGRERPDVLAKERLKLEKPKAASATSKPQRNRKQAKRT